MAQVNRELGQVAVRVGVVVGDSHVGDSQISSLLPLAGDAHRLVALG